METGPINRNEKLSSLKLTMVQYGILLMMLALAAGLWRLQVLGADNYRQLAEQNRIRKEPVLAARGKLFDRENRLIVDNYPSVSCFLVREQNQNIDADLPLIAKGPEPRSGPAARHAAPLPRLARLPAHPHQAGHYRRRRRLH
jgi:penicillin-binding protein 2